MLLSTHFKANKDMPSLSCPDFEELVCEVNFILNDSGHKHVWQSQRKGKNILLLKTTKRMTPSKGQL